jgi:hypothetical protein
MQNHPISSAGVYRDDPLQRARRMAQRSRAASACLSCKASKARCSDYRPCARCKKAGGTGVCTDPQKEQPKVSLNGWSASIDTFEVELDGSATRAMFSSEYHYLHPQLPRTSSFSPFPTSFMPVNPNAQYTWNDAMNIELSRQNGWPKERGELNEPGQV